MNDTWTTRKCNYAGFRDGLHHYDRCTEVTRYGIRHQPRVVSVGGPTYVGLEHNFTWG